MESTHSPSLTKLFLTFAKVGVMTFGGGYAMLPILEREIVSEKKWATEKDLANYFAIGQCTPGIIAVNTATFIGIKTKGVLGGIAATLGVVFPSLIIIMALAGVIEIFSENIFVQKAFMGIRACICVLIINAIYKLWKSAVDGKITFIIFLASALSSIILKLSPVSIVLGIIVFSVLYEITYASNHKGAAP